MLNFTYQKVNMIFYARESYLIVITILSFKNLWIFPYILDTNQSNLIFHLDISSYYFYHLHETIALDTNID